MAAKIADYPCIICGEAGWVEIEGRYYCRVCYLKLRNKEYILFWEQENETGKGVG